MEGFRTWVSKMAMEDKYKLIQGTERKVQGTEGQENQPKPAHLSPEQPIGPEMDRWTMKDQEDQQDQPKPARPSTAQISPEMDRWTMEDQGRPGSSYYAPVACGMFR